MCNRSLNERMNNIRPKRLNAKVVGLAYNFVSGNQNNKGITVDSFCGPVYVQWRI